MLSAGAPVPLALLRRVQHVLPAAELHTPYGMTEVLPVTDISLARDARPAGSGNGVCVGRPLPGVRLGISALDALAGSTGSPLPSPERHRRDLRSRRTRQGSVRPAVGNRAGQLPRPGWHRTGDVGHLDAPGRLWVEGRLVHVITTADGPVTPVGAEQRIEARRPVTGGRGRRRRPRGHPAAVAVVVLPERHRRRPDWRTPALAAAASGRRGWSRWRPCWSVATLPMDIRHPPRSTGRRVAAGPTRVLGGAGGPP